MSHTPSLESLLRVLPEVPDLVPLREALLGASLPDPDKLWASAGHYTTYDKRVVAPAALVDALAAGRAAALEQVERSYRGAGALLAAAATDSAPDVVACLLEAGAEAEGAGDLDHAAAWYDVAARLSAVLPDRSPLIQALRRLARSRLAAGAVQEAAVHYGACLEQATLADDDDARAIALTGIGNALSFQGAWDEARRHYESALDLQPADATVPRAQLQVNLAMVAREQGRHLEARAWLDEARRGWSSLSRVEHSGWHNEAGMLALALEDRVGAERELEAALDLADGPFTRAMVLDSLAAVAIAAGQLGTAESTARRAEQEALDAGSPRALAEIYTRLGVIFRLRGDANGVTFFEKAMELCRRHGYGWLEAVASHEYAAFRNALGDEEEARAWAARARDLFEQVSSST